MTDTEKVPSYPLSDIPSFVIHGKKSELSLEELDYQCQKLREENHQLQLRILGVNELARLLQDRNELVAVLKERNKRLEVSVVRLENRCANFERQIKSQKSNNVPSMKAGQSPFIPGPSRQILEGLMQENSELKKTVNSLQRKGSSGYLEAVKTTQLEEFIEQQKQEIDQLRSQINSLTSSGIEDESSISSGRVMSLPANVTETGPLWRQLLKMQQMMTVKDRFCTLLSQQVTELQKKLNHIQNESLDKSTTSGENSESVKTGTQPISETHPPEDSVEMEQKLTKSDDLSQYKKTLDKTMASLETERKEKIELVQQMGQLEENVRKVTEEKEELRDKLASVSQLYSTMLLDNGKLREEVEVLQAKLGSAEGPDHGSPGKESDEVEKLKKQISELQMTMDKQVQDYSKELKSKEVELRSATIELSEANYRYMVADSELTKYKDDLVQKESELHELHSKFADLQTEKDSLDRESHTSELSKYKRELLAKDSQISQLQTNYSDALSDKDALQSQNSDLQYNILDLRTKMSKLMAFGTFNPTIPSMHAGGAPSIISGLNQGDGIVSKDHPKYNKTALLCRDPVQPPGPLNLQQSRGNTRAKSPAHQLSNRGQGGVSTGPHPHISGTPHGHTNFPVGMGRPSYNTSPTPIMQTPSPFGTVSGHSGSRSTMGVPMTSHTYYQTTTPVTQPVPTFVGTPPPRPLAGGPLYNPQYSSGGARFMSSSGHPPMTSSQIPPLRSASAINQMSMPGSQMSSVFGPSSSFPPPRIQYRPEGYSYQSEIRDRPTGSTSPHPLPPPHDNSPPHYSQFGGGSSGPQPPHGPQPPYH